MPPSMSHPAEQFQSTPPQDVVGQIVNLVGQVANLRPIVNRPLKSPGCAGPRPISANLGETSMVDRGAGTRARRLDTRVEAVFQRPEHEPG